MGYVVAAYVVVLGGVSGYLGWLAHERRKLLNAVVDDKLDSNPG